MCLEIFSLLFVCFCVRFCFAFCHVPRDLYCVVVVRVFCVCVFCAGWCVCIFFFTLLFCCVCFLFSHFFMKLYAGGLRESI